MNLDKKFSHKMYLMSFICTILVVYIHVYNLEVYEIKSGIIFQLETFMNYYLARMAVPFFFISSSFWTFSKQKRIKEFYRSRITSVVIPYILWNIIFMLSYFILNQLSLAHVEGMNDFCDLIKGIFFYKYHYVYWFMYQLILLSILYPVFSWILKSKRNSVSLFYLAIVIYLLFGEIPYGTIPFIQLESIIYYFFGALLGNFYKANIIAIHNKERKNLIFISSLSLIILALIDFTGFNITIINNLKLVRNIFLIIFVFLSLDFVCPKINNNYFKYSFIIYSLHSLILEIIGKLVYILFPHTHLFAFVDYIFAPILAIAIILILCKLVDNTKIYKILSGQR